MRYNPVVATHHKSGTVWMDGVFKAIAGDVGAQYIDFYARRGQPGALDRGPFIVLCYDSDFCDCASLLDRDDVRVLHLIRDPRDVVISAMHYHTASRETGCMSRSADTTTSPISSLCIGCGRRSRSMCSRWTIRARARCGT
jgi:hypothetical protein